MKNYENISNNCKIMWHENFELCGQEYTQVSGYVFDNKICAPVSLTSSGESPLTVAFVPTGIKQGVSITP